MKFVVFSMQRSGSTWVTGVLNGFPGVATHGELFLPRPRRRLNGWNPDSPYPRFVERASDRRSLRPFSVFAYLDSLYAEPGTVGFKLMYSQLRLYPEAPLYLIGRRISVIHVVRRSALDIVVSQAVRLELGRAHLRAGETAPDLRVRLDTASLVPELRRIRRKQSLARRLLTVARLRHLEVAYEDLLRDEEEFRRLWEFLDVGEEWRMPDASLAKIRTDSLRDTLSNYEDVEAALSGTEFAAMLD